MFWLIIAVLIISAVALFRRHDPGPLLEAVLAFGYRAYTVLLASFGIAIIGAIFVGGALYMIWGQVRSGSLFALNFGDVIVNLIMIGFLGFSLYAVAECVWLINRAVRGECKPVMPGSDVYGAGKLAGFEEARRAATGGDERPDDTRVRL